MSRIVILKLTKPQIDALWAAARAGEHEYADTVQDGRKVAALWRALEILKAA